jgi:hypothetical protein
VSKFNKKNRCSKAIIENFIEYFSKKKKNMKNGKLEN